MAGRFVINREGESFRFLLKSEDDTLLMTSRFCETEADALALAKRFASLVMSPVEDQTLEEYSSVPAPKYELFRDSADCFRFRLTDGTVLAVSTPMPNKPLCLRGLDAVAAATADARFV